MKTYTFLRNILIAVACAGSLNASAAEIEACKFKKPADGDIAGAKATLDKLKAECIPRIQRIHTCVVRTRLLMEDINEVTKVFVVSDTSKPLMVDAALKGAFDIHAVDMSLWSNFSALEKDYQTSLDSIDAFVSKFREKTDDKKKLVDFLAELDSGYNLTTANLADLSIRESALLTYIDQASMALDQSADNTKPEIQWLASDACKDADLKVGLALTQDSISKITQKIDAMRAFILRARQARAHLIQYTYESIRHDLETRYRDQAIKELSALNSTIDTILQANRIMEQYQLWTLGLLSDNERSSTETYYLQFEASQQNNAVDFMTAKEFRDRLLLATTDHPEVATPYMTALNNQIAGFEDKVNRVIKMGWTGFLARQKLIANKRLETPEKYPVACVANFENYIAQANTVTTIEQYRVVEALYKTATLSCRVTK